MKNTTKKITSILLILTIILSCFALVGCNVIDSLSLEGYSELSSEDLKIIANYCSSFEQDKFADYFPNLPYTFETKINLINEKDYTFYETSVGNSYYICGYIDSFFETLLYFTVGIKSNNLKWYRVESVEQIKEKINGLQLYAKYLVYNGTIKKDIVNNIDINQKCKFSFLLSENNRYTESISKLEKNELLYTFDKKITLDDETILFNSFDVGNSYPVYIIDEQNKYMVMHHYSTFNYDDYYETLSYQLGEYYEVLLPYFVYSDDINETVHMYENRYETKINVGISIDAILDLINK